MSLIASVSRGFPMGALISLKSKIGEGLIFARRPIEGEERPPSIAHDSGLELIEVD